MRHFLTGLAILLFISCDQQPGALAVATNETVVAGAVANGDQHAPAPAEPRKIVRTGEIGFQVGDLDVARATVRREAEASGGYVAHDASDELAHASRLVLRVRIPAERFETFLAALETLGEMERHHLEASDATAQWIDVEARLVAKRAMEKRYLELVGRAENVNQVLVVERELGIVRGEIESMESQMRALRDQVAMSTVTITCLRLQARSSFHNAQFGAALEAGWTLLLRCLVAVLHVWPFLLAAAIAIVWRISRRPRPRVPATA